MGSWLNDDGLYIKYGPDSYKSAHTAGEYSTMNGAGEGVIEVVINLADLTTTETILNDVVLVPENAHITWVETVAVVAGATGTSIDVGLIAKDRSTEVDYDGLLAAFPLTGNYDTVGDTVKFLENSTIPASVTGTGALIGTEITTAGGAHLSASYAAGSAFTAGKLKVRVGYVSKGVDNP